MDMTIPVELYVQRYMIMTIETLGTGIRYSIKGKSLVLEIKLDAKYGLSKSEKSITVATTHGGVDVAGIMVNLNAYIKNNKSSFQL